MKYETWKSYLETKQKLSKVRHTASPLEKSILETQIDYLEAKIMSAPEYYWTDLIKEYKK